MPCNGYNHYPWCECNFRGGMNSSSGNNLFKLLTFPQVPNKVPKSYQSDYFSYTNPNAKCPVCDKNVYYYQNHYGSKVYFDELGKPWPKHKCMTVQKISSLQYKKVKFIIDYNFDELSELTANRLKPLEYKKCTKEGEMFRLIVKDKRNVFVYFVDEIVFPEDLLLYEKKDGVELLQIYRDMPIELILHRSKPK
jgi:hypothetical protein